MRSTRLTSCSSKMELEGFEQLVSLPTAKSKVWEHFGFPADSRGKILDKKKRYCKICVPRVTIPYSTNTSNLTYHLQKKPSRRIRKNRGRKK